MKCHLCSLDLRESYVDRVRCDECSIVICAPCDSPHSVFMVVCLEEGITRCPSCQKREQLRLEAVRRAASPGLAQTLGDQALQHLESNNANASLSAKVQPKLIIQELSTLSPK